MDIKKIFVDKTNIDEQDILSVENIHKGYTNENFLITTKQGKYVLRIPLKQASDFENELKAYNLSGENNFIWFDVETGQYIKKYIEAVHADFSDKQQLKLVLDKIDELANTFNVEGIKSASFDEYIEYNDLDEIKTLLFKSLVLKYSDTEKVFCHHDLNEANVLYNHEIDKIYFIDYEWARMDDIYFEYASLAINKNVDKDFMIKEANLDTSKLDHFIYMHLCMSYMWCNYINTEKSKALQGELLKDIIKIFEKIL